MAWRCPSVLILLHIYSNALQTRFYHGMKHYIPWSSLIWVHIVYHIHVGYLRLSTKADGMAGIKVVTGGEVLTMANKRVHSSISGVST